MDKVAVIKDGVVENIIVADGKFTFPGVDLIPLDGKIAEIGDLWDGERFIPAHLEKTPEERIAELEQLVADLTELVLLGGGE